MQWWSNCPFFAGNMFRMLIDTKFWKTAAEKSMNTWITKTWPLPWGESPNGIKCCQLLVHWHRFVTLKKHLERKCIESRDLWTIHSIKSKDRITPHVNFFQKVRCENGMGQAGNTIGNCGRQTVRKNSVWKCCVCVTVLCVKEACVKGGMWKSCV